MRDRRNGIALLALATGMLVYGLVDLARGRSSPGAVEIVLGVAGLALGVLLVARARRS
jgi:hypothetical protein